MSTSERVPPRLLCIDDSLAIHRLLKARLKYERLEVHGACTCVRGLAAARALTPAVILLDMEMPDGDGFSVLRQLKADADLRDIPVIIVSSNTDTNTKVRALDMGAQDFIAKPFDLAELRARVRAAARLSSMIAMLAHRARLDGLTGLWNRTYFDDRLQQELAEAERHDRNVALIFCDLDRFKELNDAYGHPFGDVVLQHFAEQLAQGRAGDVACRYGGEEFAIILPGAHADQAVEVARRICAALRQTTWPRVHDLVVTASAGVTDLHRAGAASVDAIIASADAALYAAKADGRDAVRLAEPASPIDPAPPIEHIRRSA